MQSDSCGSQLEHKIYQGYAQHQQLYDFPIGTLIIVA
jgi:hypothetical protein